MIAGRSIQEENCKGGSFLKPNSHEFANKSDYNHSKRLLAKFFTKIANERLPVSKVIRSQDQEEKGIHSFD